MSIVKQTTIEEGTQITFSFEIDNLTPSFDGIIKSERILLGSAEWVVQFYPKGENDFAKLILFKVAGTACEVNFRATILSDFDDSIITTKEISFPFTTNHGRGWSDFISRNYLFDAIYSCNFKIECQLILLNEAKVDSLAELIFSNNLKKSYTSGEFDLNIQVGDQTFPAHRLVLSAYSKILQKRILKIGDPSAPLKLEDSQPEAVKMMLNFFDGEKLNLTNDNVKETLMAAKKYQIESLQKLCENFIYENLTFDNALENFVFAGRRNLLGLWKQTLGFIDKNIIEITELNVHWKNFTEVCPIEFQKIFQAVVETVAFKFEDISVFDPQAGPSKSSATAGSSADLSKNINDHHEKLFESSIFADVDFEIDGQILKAHKNVLASRSKIFQAMFANDKLESTMQSTLKVIDFDYKTMRQLLRYIYCEKVSDLDENAVYLFLAADKYNVPDLRKMCETSIVLNFSANNITEIFRLADLYTCLWKIKEQAVNFVIKNFDKVFGSDQWNDFAKTNSRILSELLTEILENQDFPIDADF